MSLQQCTNVGDFRQLARRKLPAPLFDYLEGGADDEWSTRNNTSAFDRYELIPRCLTDVSTIDLRTRVLGCELSMPLWLSPIAAGQLFHPDKERALARAAASHNV